MITALSPVHTGVQLDEVIYKYAMIYQTHNKMAPMALVYFPVQVNFAHRTFLLSFSCFFLPCEFFAIEVTNPTLCNICCIVLPSFSTFSEDN